MKSILSLVFITTFCFNPIAASAQRASPAKKFDLTIDNIMRGPGLVGYEPTNVRWSADSKSIIYNQVKDNISNLWSQAINGGQPKQISDFKEGLIYGFDLSRDGKQMLISRGPYSRDAVLISNEK